MPEAWDEELGREVFGEVRPGVEMGLRDESRQTPVWALFWEGNSLLSTGLPRFQKEPSPAASLVYLSLLVTLTPKFSPGFITFPQKSQRRRNRA